MYGDIVVVMGCVSLQKKGKKKSYVVKKSSAFFVIAILVFSFIFALLPPVHANNTNLTPIPTAWKTATNGMTPAVGGVSDDTIVTHDEYESVQIIPGTSSGNPDGECDGPWLSVSPGEQITFSCWIETSAATLSADVGNPQAGGRIGIDFYGSLGGINGLSTPDGSGTPTDSYNTYVLFGTSTWAQVTMDFIVPQTYEYVYGSTGQTGHYSTGEMVVPTDIIPWMQVWSNTQGTNEQGTAWFANAELHINPSGSPSLIIDNLVVLFSLLFNIDMIFVFVFRGQRRTQSEAKLGPVSNLLLIPFSILWLLNLLSNSDLGRLITSFPVIIFLAYDLWYRTATKRKPQYQSENWPLGRYIYLLLYVIGGIMLNGYAFLVSLPYGFVVLSSFCGSLIAYGYYQYSHEKFEKSQNRQAIHNE
jgi:hypothetical protein